MESRLTRAERRLQILAELRDAVVQFDQELVRATAARVLRERVDVLDAIQNGLVAGIEQVGELYASGEYFWPEVSQCADTLRIGYELLQPYAKLSRNQRVSGTAVIGTVAGDKHDIGKNLLKLCLQVTGFATCDLGTSVCAEKWVEQVLRNRAQVVCLSVATSSASLEVARVIDMLRLKNPALKIVVGGAAVTLEQVRQWDVDAYAPDLFSARRTVVDLLRLIHPTTESALTQELAGEGLQRT